MGKRSGTKPAQGVEIRPGKNGGSLRIRFMYRGIECKEPFNLRPTSENIRYLSNLREEILLKIGRGTFNYGEYFPESPRARLFGHIVTDRTVHHLIEDFKAEKQRTTERSTFEGYDKSANIIDAEFGHLRITDLSPQIIRAWILKQTASAKRIRNLITPLRWICDRAVTDDLIKHNPMERVVISQLISKEQKRTEFEPDPFDIEEMRAIIRACAPGHERNFWQFAFWSGLRTSELIALKWEHVDFYHSVVYVKTAHVSGETKSTKTAAGTREVRMLPLARQALTSQKELTWLKHGHVFLSPKTGKPWSGDSQVRRTSWNYICQRAGVRRRNPYQTRHTFASIQLSNGEPELYVADQLGHKTVEMIRKHYGRWIAKSDDGSGYQPDMKKYDFEMKNR